MCCCWCRNGLSRRTCTLTACVCVSKNRAELYSFNLHLHLITDTPLPGQVCEEETSSATLCCVCSADWSWLQIVSLCRSAEFYFEQQTILYIICGFPLVLPPTSPSLSLLDQITCDLEGLLCTALRECPVLSKAPMMGCYVYSTSVLCQRLL